MKRVYNSFIERLKDETGYSTDYLSERFDEAMDRGISVPDFIDSMLDESVFYDREATHV